MGGVEQRMIESLGEHGVDPFDLVPALMTTHTVKNPEYDPGARKRKEVDEMKVVMGSDDGLEVEREPPPAYAPLAEEGDSQEMEGVAGAPAPASSSAPSLAPPSVSESLAPAYVNITQTDPDATPRCPTPFPVVRKAPNPFGDDQDDDIPAAPMPLPSASSSTSTLHRPSVSRLPYFDEDDDDGDIGRAATPSPLHTPLDEKPPPIPLSTPPAPTTPLAEPLRDPDKTPSRGPSPVAVPPDAQEEVEDPEEQAPLPSLPGVSTKMSTTDELITLDIRWTVVRCFLLPALCSFS